MFHADNCYYFPAVRILSRRLRTNTVSNTAFRGFGGPQGMLFAERLMDQLSEREREILRLRFHEDLTQSEIGERVGCSQMHVSRLVRGALAKLSAAAGA